MKTKNFVVRNVSEESYIQLQEISKKYGYPSFNEFMLAQIQRILENDGLDVYDNKFAEDIVLLKEQQEKLINQLLKNELLLLALNGKQDILEEVTLSWLHFMDDVDALESERNVGGGF
ncbi:hypothetical protein ACXM1Q_005510 [Streptococcus sp. 10F2]